MTRKASLLSRVGSLFDILGAARDAAAAVEAHRAPNTRALKTLGIDPEAFKAIRF